MSYPRYEQSSNEFTSLARSELAPRKRPDGSPNGAHTLAKALGWFSIGLGLTELAMPRQLGRAIGVGEQPTLLPLLGLREIASGIGILTRSDPTNGVRARVAGDLLDLALLGSAFASTRSREDRVAAATATAAVLGVTALDVYCASSLPRVPAEVRETKRLIRVTKSIAINRPLEELYSYWRQLENLPRVMRHLESVREIDVKQSRWIAAGPAGSRVEWDAEITTDRPNQLIAWQSRGADVPNQGFVEFKRLPADRGTVVTVHLQYAPPTGRLGATIAKLFGRAPEQEIEIDLRRWKQLMETGEVATTEGQPSGKRSAISRQLP
jgi:uncharacterized membrane protein